MAHKVKMYFLTGFHNGIKMSGLSIQQPCEDFLTGYFWPDIS
ncbi:hypothetical protein NTGBS_130036 [Candidatus Nitrotoga sp. BS]|nr:hypothetical protein NTGBS_130036 [Candidatus Nitrotoga sp. BS]